MAFIGHPQSLIAQTEPLRPPRFVRRKQHSEEALSDAADLGPDLAAGVTMADIPDGGMKAGHIRGAKALFARLGDDIFAIGDTCSHLGGPLHKGLVVDHTVRCPWHHACFSLRSGEALTAPAFKTLPRWEVAVEDNLVRVRNPVPLSTPPRLPDDARSNKRFVIIGGGAADGSTVDAEGCVWNALVYDGRLVRYDPSGRVDRMIQMPVKKVTSVMFGGPKLDILFVTSMAKPPLPRFPGDGLLRGSLFAIYDLGIKGLPEPRFGT